MQGTCALLAATASTSHGTSFSSFIIMSNYLALWSSLRTLEITKESAKVHDTFFGNIEETGVLAGSLDAKTVTACSVEVTYPEGSNDQHRTNLFTKKKSQGYKTWLMTEISAPSVWNTKVGAFSFIKMSRYKCACEQTDLPPSFLSS